MRISDWSSDVCSSDLDGDVEDLAVAAAVAVAADRVGNVGDDLIADEDVAIAVSRIERAVSEGERGNAVRPDRERHRGARIIGEHDRRASADDGIIGGVAREMEGVTTLFDATEQGNVGASDDGYVFLATLGAEDRERTGGVPALIVKIGRAQV